MSEKISARLSQEAIDIVHNKMTKERRRSFANALESLILEFNDMNKVVRAEQRTTPQMANQANTQNRSIIAQNVKANSITINDGEEHA